MAGPIFVPNESGSPVFVPDRLPDREVFDESLADEVRYLDLDTS